MPQCRWGLFEVPGGGGGESTTTDQSRRRRSILVDWLVCVLCVQAPVLFTLEQGPGFRRPLSHTRQGLYAQYSVRSVLITLSERNLVPRVYARVFASEYPRPYV